MPFNPQQHGAIIVLRIHGIAPIFLNDRRASRYPRRADSDAPNASRIRLPIKRDCAFGGLEGDIAAKPITDHDIDRAFGDGIALNEADIIHFELCIG